MRRQYSHSHSLEAVPAPRILRTEGRVLCKQGMKSRCDSLQTALWCACCSLQQLASSGLWLAHMNMEGPTNRSDISPGSQKRQQQSHCESVGNGCVLKRLFCNSGHLGALCSSRCRAFPIPTVPRLSDGPCKLPLTPSVTVQPPLQQHVYAVPDDHDCCSDHDCSASQHRHRFKARAASGEARVPSSSVAAEARGQPAGGQGRSGDHEGLIQQARLTTSSAVIGMSKLQARSAHTHAGAPGLHKELDLTELSGRHNDVQLHASPLTQPSSPLCIPTPGEPAAAAFSGQCSPLCQSDEAL